MLSIPSIPSFLQNSSLDPPGTQGGSSLSTDQESFSILDMPSRQSEAGPSALDSLVLDFGYPTPNMNSNFSDIAPIEQSVSIGVPMSQESELCSDETPLNSAQLEPVSRELEPMVTEQVKWESSEQKEGRTSPDGRKSSPVIGDLHSESGLSPANNVTAPQKNEMALTNRISRGVDGPADQPVRARSVFSPPRLILTQTDTNTDAYIQEENGLPMGPPKQLFKPMLSHFNTPQPSTIPITTSPDVRSRFPTNNDIMASPITGVRRMTEATEEEESLVDRDCPTCTRRFPRIQYSQEDFESHVLECVEEMCERANRSCPVCQQEIPISVPQTEYEAHVMAHFAEEENDFTLVERQPVPIQ